MEIKLNILKGNHIMARRINKVIELWEDKQPIYLTHPTDLSYDA